MRKQVVLIITAFLLLFGLSEPILAKNQVDTIDIQAVVNEDGSMIITQIWQGTFEEGTEIYIPMNVPDYLSLTNLSVSDQNQIYNAVQNWDINWSFDEKKEKFGVVSTNVGFEICFGISQYGENRYTITYQLDQVIGSYSDKDGVNFRFVNDGMNTTPTDVTVQIQLADDRLITDEIADVWGFGFTGEVGFENGSIIAKTTTPISERNHITIMFSLDKGILIPLRQKLGSFEEVKEKAFQGSDYDIENIADEEVSVWEVILSMLISIVLPIVLIIWIHRRKKKRKIKKLQRISEQFGYFRDLPNEGNLGATYTLGRMFDVCEDGAILATGMLRLIQLECLAPIEAQETSWMGKSKETVTLRLQRGNHTQMNEYDEYLYTILEAAAGSDGILQPKELERFANQNDKLLRAYIEKYNDVGKAYLSQKQCMKRMSTPAKWSDLTSVGEQELGELLGLKRYLEDFSLIAERNVKEIAIWRELLSYAMLFGIAEQVAEQLKNLYPEISSELTEYKQNMDTSHSYNYLLYSNMRKAEQAREQKKRSGGGGGFSSLGGGGGFIGGSSGGGTR